MRRSPPTTTPWKLNLKRKIIIKSDSLYNRPNITLMTEREFETIINKLDSLERKVDRDNKLLAEKIELYRQTSEAQINSIRAEVEAFQEANKQQIEANKQQIEAFQEASKQQIEAFQEANRQQLNISLGVLVTAAITIVVSVVLGMQ